MSELFYCAWCGIEMRWWRPFLGRHHCKDCSDVTYQGPGFWEMHPFHSRVGMKEE